MSRAYVAIKETGRLCIIRVRKQVKGPPVITVNTSFPKTEFVVLMASAARGKVEARRMPMPTRLDPFITEDNLASKHEYQVAIH